MRWLCALVIVAGATQPATLPTPGFHHLHLNSINPEAAIDFYTKQFPITSKGTFVSRRDDRRTEPGGNRTDRGPIRHEAIVAHVTIRPVTRDAIRQFLERDWAWLAAEKARAWQHGKRTPAADLRAANELRRHVAAVRPDWPDASDREEDLRTHVRVSEALGAVSVGHR